MFHSWKEKFIVVAVAGLMTVSMTGCGELEPIEEPETVDLQLTVDTLKTQLRDAQRNATELRAEIEARRQELADAQVARAQMEGRVREAERRLVEARQVIELQREELIAARTERERIFRSRAPLQGRMKQRRKRSSQPVRPADNTQEIAPTSAGAVMRHQQNAQALPSLTDDPSVAVPSTRALATSATLRAESSAGGETSEHIAPSAPARHISVKPGDTLWSLARKYGISVKQLRSLNHLTDNLIIVGQALRVPGNRGFPDSIGERTENNP
ncbi:LysM peptidoglycan-binding domain-containing protein [Petrachloros mirabilis]